MKRLSVSIIQVSDMEKEVEIYVRMVDGTEVFVPVKAIQIGANAYPFRRICNPTAMRRGFVIPS